MPFRLWGCAVMGVVLLFVAGSADFSRAADSTTKPQSLAELLSAIESQQAKMPRDRFDPAVIAAQADRDPQKVVAWVKDNTRSVPYDGCLRGPLGVLMDRAGNSLDRSMLLAQLLELSGYDARIVSAKLPAADLSKTFSGAAAQPAPPQEQADADAKQRLQMQEQAKQIAAMIQSKVGQLSIAAPPTNGLHYWVQYNDGKAWVDLDPSDTNHSNVKAEGEPIALDPKTHWIAKASADLLHSVKLQLIVERWENGKLLESPLVSIAFDASRGPLAPATLMFNPVDQKTSKTGGRNFTTGTQLRQKLLTETAWCPILADGKAGGRMARMFNDAGIVGDLPKAFDGAAEVGAVARSGFGGLLGGTSGASASAEEAPTVLTALVADYQITVPGQPLRHVRRFIFDSIGPEARSSNSAIPKPKWTEQQKVERGAELAALHDTLVAFASLDPDVYIYRCGQRAIDAKDAAIKGERAKGRVDDLTLQKWADGVSLRTLELYAAARESSLHPGLVVAEPQIYRREIRYVPDTKATALDAQLISDLASNRLKPFAGTGGAAAVEQGVLDTLEEAVITLHDAPAAPGDNTAALFAEGAKQGIEVVAIKDANDPHLGAFDGAARARILLDLQGKQIVVAPAKPVVIDGKPRAGWWRIDPGTGQTVGEMDSGFLQDFVEYNDTQEVNGVRITRFYRSRVSDSARDWAQRVIEKRNFTSWDQWVNFLRMAQKSLDLTGALPPL